jgi:hypothetical protein
MRIIKPLQLFLFVLFGVALSFSILGQDKKIAQKDDDLSKSKAAEIILKAKKAISSKVDVSQIKNFELSFDGTYNGGVEISEKYQYNIVLADKIKCTHVEVIDNTTATTEQILNGNLSTIKQSSISSDTGVSRSLFTKTEKPDDLWIKVIKRQTAEMLLPFVLDFVFIETDGLKFVGVAESETGKADVVETNTPNGNSLRLLFDQKSHRLLMMIKKYTEAGKVVEVNYYFSDYKEISGLLIPRKVTVKGTSSIGSPLFIESNLLTLKINSVIDAKTFEIKDK